MKLMSEYDQHAAGKRHTAVDRVSDNVVQRIGCDLF